eukprot:744316_1
MSDCIYDEIENNMNVVQSTADDIYYFIHNDCSNGRYYTIQPAGINPHQTTSLPSIVPTITNTTIIATINTTIIATEINETIISTKQIENTTYSEILETTTITTERGEETTTTQFIFSTSSEKISTTSITPSPTANMCNYMIREDTYMDFYSTILENKCYSHETGSKKYECINNEFMVTEWLTDRFCDGNSDKPKKAQGKTYCISGNNKICNTISVLQYNANENCTKETFIEEYTFIINICLQYIGHKENKNEMVYIYNKYDEKFKKY